MAPKWLALFSCFALLTIAFAEDQIATVEEPHEEENGLTNFQMPDLTVTDGVMRAISFAGAVVTGVAGLAAILSLILPMMGFRTCLLTGGCEDTTAYNANSVYDQQGYGAYQYNNGFKRRSLEYVGPILKALSSAYEKYGTPAQTKTLVPKPTDTN